MKILTVTYRTNRPTPGSRYVHEHVEATAAVGKGETPAQALDKLKGEVHSLLYPELTNLRERVAKVAPTVATKLPKTREGLEALYAEHTEAFVDLLKGDMAPSVFLDQIRNAE